MAEPHLADHLIDARIAFRGREGPGQTEGGGVVQCLTDRQVGVEQVVLHDVAGQLLQLGVVVGTTVQAHLARHGVVHVEAACQRVEQGRFATATGPHHGPQPAAHAARHVVQQHLGGAPGRDRHGQIAPHEHGARVAEEGRVATMRRIIVVAVLLGVVHHGTTDTRGSGHALRAGSQLAAAAVHGIRAHLHLSMLLLIR